MELNKIDINNKEEFNKFYSALTEAFPIEERPDYSALYSRNVNNCFVIYEIILEITVGYITVWELDSFTFAEHFVILPEWRGRGIGAEALNMLKQIYSSIILEAEPPESDIAVRRIGFYTRCGFRLSDVQYLQPSYHMASAPIPLKLMAYPDIPNDIDNCISLIYKEVYGTTKEDIERANNI